MPRPGLVLGPRSQVGDHHLHRLQLLVLRRDGAHLVGDLVACHRNVLAFDTAEGKLQLIINDIKTLTLLQLVYVFIIMIILAAQDTSGSFYRAHHLPKIEVDFGRLAEKSYENTINTPTPLKKQTNTQKQTQNPHTLISLKKYPVEPGLRQHSLAALEGRADTLQCFLCSCVFKL